MYEVEQKGYYCIQETPVSIVVCFDYLDSISGAFYKCLKNNNIPYYQICFKVFAFNKTIMSSYHLDTMKTMLEKIDSWWEK